MNVIDFAKTIAELLIDIFFKSADILKNLAINIVSIILNSTIPQVTL